MGYCGSGGSNRRKVLMDKFQTFLENIDESRAICPDSPCGQTGPCVTYGRNGGGGGMGAAPMSTFNPPRAPDYMDPNKRPLITNIQVQEVRPTSDLGSILRDDPKGLVIHREVGGLAKLKDREMPGVASPELIKLLVNNKVQGYPPPGEKSPFLYRSPYPKHRELRPRSFPPPSTYHHAEAPCVICDPPIKNRPKYLIDDENYEPRYPDSFCPTRFAAPCGLLALAMAADCPPLQPHMFDRFVSDPRSNYNNTVPKQLSPFHIPSSQLLSDLVSMNYTNQFGIGHGANIYNQGRNQFPGPGVNFQNTARPSSLSGNVCSTMTGNVRAAPSPGTCGTCLDPPPLKTTCSSPCGEPCPVFHPVNFAALTDPMDPPICKSEFIRQPPCIDYYNKPCGVHNRLQHNCIEFFGKPCELHHVPQSDLEPLLLPW